MLSERVVFFLLFLIPRSVVAEDAPWPGEGNNIISQVRTSAKNIGAERAGGDLEIGVIGELVSRLEKKNALSGECRKFIRALDADLDYGFIAVPRNWKDNRGKKTHIFFYGRFKGATAAPIVFINGGPGAPGWRLFKKFYEGKALDGLPFIFFDQRGTGCSGQYPSLNEAAYQFQQYSSESIVRDLEAMRKAVWSGKRWKVFGQSFGSLVAHRYVQIAPEGLAAVYAHGFALLNDVDQYRYVSGEYGLSFVRKYYDEYPGDRGVVSRFIEEAERQRCPGGAGLGRLSCVAELLPQELSNAIRDPRNWGAVHQKLNKLSAGGLDRPQHEDASDERLSGRDIAIHTIVRQEYLPRRYDPADPFSCRDAMNRLISGRPREESIFFANCDDNHGETLALYASNLSIPVNYLSLDEFKNDLLRSPWVRFYLYSGEFDPYSPPPYFNDEARELAGRITYRMLPGAGHTEFWNNEQILMDFRNE